MSLLELLEKEYGIRCDEIVNPITDYVDTIPTQILYQNPNRIMVAIVNLGSYPIYLGFDASVSDIKGIYLGKNGGSLSLIWNEDFTIVCKEIWGISMEAPSYIYTVEVVLI